MLDNYTFGEAPDLTSVEDLDVSGNEAFFWGNSNDMNNSGEQPNQQQTSCPFYIQKIPQSDGSFRILMFLLNDFVRHAAVICSVINSATEKDTIEMMVGVEYASVEKTFSNSYRALISSVINCKAKVTSFAGTLTSMPRVALWLAADQVTVSEIGWIRMEQLAAGAIGFVADVEVGTNEAVVAQKEFSDFIVKRGLCTAEEMDEMYKNKSILSWYGEELKKRMSGLTSTQE